MENINWVITDFDRTLVQFFSDKALNLIFIELKSTYIKYGVEDKYLQGFKDPYEIWVSTYWYLVEHFEPAQAQKIHNAASDILTKSEMRAAGKAELLPGVKSTLQWLEKMQLNCAIVSTNSKEAIQLILEKNHVSKFIKNVFARDETIRMEHLKPSPTLIKRAIAELNASPRHTVFIGDSRDDMIAGKLAGVFIIGVLTGKTFANELLNAGAETVLKSFSALQDLDHIFNNYNQKGGANYSQKEEHSSLIKVQRRTD